MNHAAWIQRCTLHLLAATPALLAGCVDLRVPDPDVVYVAFGDSATDGPAERDYPELLADLLAVPQRQMANEGHSGETIADGRERLADLLADDVYVYPNAQVLLLWEGGGDLVDFIGDVDPFLFWSVDDSDYPYGDELAEKLDEIAGNLGDAIAAARSAGLDVYVATYFPIQGSFEECPALPFEIIFPGQADRANEYLALLNARIRQTATARGATLVDIARDADDLADDADNYVNCNHLSEAGNARVAEVFRDDLR